MKKLIIAAALMTIPFNSVMAETQYGAWFKPDKEDNRNEYSSYNTTISNSRDETIGLVRVVCGINPATKKKQVSAYMMRSDGVNRSAYLTYTIRTNNHTDWLSGANFDAGKYWITYDLKRNTDINGDGYATRSDKLLSALYADGDKLTIEEENTGAAYVDKDGAKASIEAAYKDCGEDIKTLAAF